MKLTYLFFMERDVVRSSTQLFAPTYRTTNDIFLYDFHELLPAVRNETPRDQGVADDLARVTAECRYVSLNKIHAIARLCPIVPSWPLAAI